MTRSLRRSIAITPVVLESSIVELRPAGEGEENLSSF